MANRVLIGENASNDYGLFVSKPGKNAVSDTGLDLIFSSDTAHGGGSISQIIDITTSSSGTYNGTGTITDLGYIPFVHITELSGSGIKGVESFWGRSTGGGSGQGSGGGMGGGGGGGGGKSQIKWSAWRATVTRTQVEIRPWMSSGSNQNFNFTSSIHGTASGLSFPGLNGGTTFRCFVYKISAS
mgnify:CR=1 FL=1